MNIICVKIGTKYSSEYVNNLFTMCKKNITKPFKFYCYTDDPVDVNPDINIIPFVDNHLDRIVFNKLFLFSEYVDSFLDGEKRVFFDLDIIIRENIDHIVETHNRDLTIIHAKWRDYSRQYFPFFEHPYNSSCLIWMPTAASRRVWEYFSKDPEAFMTKHHGGMDFFLYYEYKNMRIAIEYFPPMMFYSLKAGVDIEMNAAYDPYNPKFKGYSPTRMEHITKKIPVVLLNGNTTEADYRSFSQYYSD